MEVGGLLVHALTQDLKVWHRDPHVNCIVGYGCAEPDDSPRVIDVLFNVIRFLIPMNVIIFF
jgi:hypothetical protein